MRLSYIEEKFENNVIVHILNNKSQYATLDISKEGLKILDLPIFKNAEDFLKFSNYVNKVYTNLSVEYFNDNIVIFFTGYEVLLGKVINQNKEEYTIRSLNNKETFDIPKKYVYSLSKNNKKKLTTFKNEIKTHYSNKIKSYNHVLNDAKHKYERKVNKLENNQKVIYVLLTKESLTENQKQDLKIRKKSIEGLTPIFLKKQIKIHENYQTIVNELNKSMKNDLEKVDTYITNKKRLL